MSLNIVLKIGLAVIEEHAGLFQEFMYLNARFEAQHTADLTPKDRRIF